MKTYNPDEYEGIHTIKYTIQRGEYKGYFTTEMGGNCKGASLMNTSISEDVDPETDIIECDCELKYDYYDDCFDCVLHNESGDKVYLQGLDEQELSDMLVAIEIVDYKPEFEDEEEEYDSRI